MHTLIHSATSSGTVLAVSGDGGKASGWIVVGVLIVVAVIFLVGAKNR